MSNNNIKKLKAFVAVAESGSVTVAANRLALTQSGVSRQITAMEEDVGFALFDRVRGRLSVSQKGTVFLRHVRRTLDVVENLPRAALAIASGAEDRVVIAGNKCSGSWVNAVCCRQIYCRTPGSISWYYYAQPTGICGSWPAWSL